MPSPNSSTLTAIPGIQVGHWHDSAARTGCTVVLCPEAGCVGSADVRGGAPGTRETALLAPQKTVERVHAVTLAGGSAFGLAAATGVTRYLEAQGRGFPTPFGPVPIVPAAVIYDLGVGDPQVRPDAEAGYGACVAASSAPVALGRVGAGAGATCGKYLGFERAQASGLGSAAVTVAGATVAALSVANPVGDIVNPATGAVVAGVVGETRGYVERFLGAPDLAGGNTTLVVVATDAVITKAEAKALAESAHVGIARVTRPSHTVQDGDTTFVLSTGDGPELPLMLLSVAVQEVVAEAILAGASVSPGVSGTWAACHDVFMDVGVLALQGAFREHKEAFERLGAAVTEVRLPKHLDGLAGVVIPGGESTTMAKLMRLYGLDEALSAFHEAGGAVWGTCAGAIAVATGIAGRPEQPRLGLLPMQVARNDYGRQVASFETDLEIADLPGPFRALFIRAPRITEVGDDVDVLARYGGDPVMIARGQVMATTFHPELSGDDRVHARFLSLAGS